MMMQILLVLLLQGWSENFADFVRSKKHLMLPQERGENWKYDCSLDKRNKCDKYTFNESCILKLLPSRHLERGSCALCFVQVSPLWFQVVLILKYILRHLLRFLFSQKRGSVELCYGIRSAWEFDSTPIGQERVTFSGFYFRDILIARQKSCSELPNHLKLHWQVHAFVFLLCVSTKHGYTNLYLKHLRGLFARRLQLQPIPSLLYTLLGHHCFSYYHDEVAKFKEFNADLLVMRLGQDNFSLYQNC